MNIEKINEINEMCVEWTKQKEIEKNSIEKRRQLEDEIKSKLELTEEFDGIESIETGSCFVKISGRLDRKVDADKLQEIAIEYGLTDHLTSLFRWKPEVNLSVWKNANETITKPLSAAITTKAGRPSFSITMKEGE